MPFDAWDAFCSGAGTLAAGGGTLPAALFLAGLTGSVAHCMPMCGPFVMAQVADRLALVPAPRLCELTRLRSSLLLPYHFGRLTTYAGLGAAAASIGAVLAALPWFGSLAGALLLLAALMFAARALHRLAPSLGTPPWIGPPWIGALARLAGRIDRTHWAGSLALGLLLGFLPCGLLYTALIAASASAAPAQGALAMASFGLGTVPGLIAIGLLGHAAGRRLGRAIAVVGPAVMLINAAMLAALAWQRLAA